MRLTRRGVLLGAATLPLAARAGAANGALTFLTLGDWGREGEERQTDVAKQMGRAAARRACRFVVSLGDNFYERGVESVEDEQWRTSFEQIYTAPSLQVPWYPVLGNHDHHGNVQAQIDYSKTSKRWRMPARYYTRSETCSDGATVDMFFLDTNDIEEEYDVHAMGDDEAENQRELAEAWAEVPQLGWFESALKASKADWKLVFGHHTIVSGGEHGPTRELVASIKPLFARYGVNAYFCGHDHDLQHLVEGGVTYFVCGAGSKSREVAAIEHTRFRSDREGFAAVAVDGRGLALEFIDYTGDVLHRAELNRKS